MMVNFRMLESVLVILPAASAPDKHLIGRWLLIPGCDAELGSQLIRSVEPAKTAFELKCGFIEIQLECD